MTISNICSHYKIDNKEKSNNKAEPYENMVSVKLLVSVTIVTSAIRVHILATFKIQNKIPKN